MSDTLFSAMNTSAAGMSAQRSRMDIVASNIANAESTRTESGGPYRRRQVVFQTTDPKKEFNHIFESEFQGSGPKTVKVSSIIEDQRPFREIYNPSHPDADSRGMVKMPNVNSVEEMVDMQSASRSFEANVTTMEAAKRMFQKSLELLR
ncbi:MAG: flagellar basal body rod protein FlgC [Mariprofundaceae bacterium]|nr:flagellar basal body rod protein FlgC [Mariprofundaceae bacterium]